MATQKKTSIILLVLGATVSLVVSAVVSKCVSESFNTVSFSKSTPKKEVDFNDVLKQTANEINALCPMNVDEMTRLDNAVALSNRTLQYNYTLFNTLKKDVNMPEFQKSMKALLIESIKEKPEMKSFRDNKVTLAYNYKDKNGEFLLKINVTPEMYE